MKVKIFLILSIVLLVGGLVSAADTNVVVKTIPGYKAYIRFIDPDSGSYINSFTYPANYKGEINFVFSTTKEEFNVKIWLSLDGVAIINKQFNETYTSGQDLTLEIYPAWYTQTHENSTTPDNETENTTIATSTSNAIINQTNNSLVSGIIQENQNSSNKDKKIVSLLIKDGKVSPGLKIVFYILALIALGIIIYLGINQIKKIKIIDNPDKGSGIKVRKLSEFNKSKHETVAQEEKRIASAKRKIEEAEAELRKIRNEDKIDAMQKKIAEDQKELARLKSGR